MREFLFFKLASAIRLMSIVILSIVLRIHMIYHLWIHTVNTQILHNIGWFDARPSY